MQSAVRSALSAFANSNSVVEMKPYVLLSWVYESPLCSWTEFSFAKVV